MATYLRFAGESLPSAVGMHGPHGAWCSDGNSGHLCYGPYVSLEPGRYVAGVRIKKLPECAAGRVTFDVYSPRTGVLCSRLVYASQLFESTSSLIHFEFSIEENITQLEARLFVQEGVLVQLDELVLFSQDARVWSG